MADLNPVAKRIHNVAPKPVRLTLDGGESAVYRMHSTQFFQREFQAEGERLDEAGVEYRLVSSEDAASVLLGRKGPDDDGWTMVGEVVEAARAAE
ncbi:hypothetical protein C474_06235 [Halogeometricum pallidum JCM 14848]|uniref:DUF8072 domain-containing protein n=1 Tax=Halogeometricum pallidum JCM 14848 TaxID=1227487 RepID=M0DFA5_HALPD|nr:hypothetical protein [Halogeometricum pallidum]ELZ32849.1 hypothetical protein C474_06235 [Halogeometricum pallidum JCM 14848]